MRVRQGILLGLCIGVTGCHGWYVPGSGGVPPALVDQAARAREITQGTADNALIQARVAYGNLAPRLSTTGRVDREAYAGLKRSLLPPMLVAANALSAGEVNPSDVGTSVTEFRQLYTDTLEQALNGINNNLQVYQAYFETGQALPAAPPTADRAFADEAMAALADLFVASEDTEAFAAELGRFAQVLPEDYTQTVLSGIRHQQTTIMNGVVNFTALNSSPAAARQAYATIAASLTQPALLNRFRELAVAVHGLEGVAFRQDEVTPAQPNPNLIVMVVQEAPTLYRLISVKDGKVVNEVVNDTRGLSASDLLHQTNVVRVGGTLPSPAPTQP